MLAFRALLYLWWFPKTTCVHTRVPVPPVIVRFFYHCARNGSLQLAVHNQLTRFILGQFWRDEGILLSVMGKGAELKLQAAVGAVSVGVYNDHILVAVAFILNELLDP